MKRSTKVKWGELKVGLLITFAVVILIWASFTGGGTSIFEAKIEYRAYFANVNGLVSGAPVWIAGVEVGNVSHVKFVNLDSARQIEIGIRVKKSVSKMVTTDAQVRLGTIGLLGDKYIEIVPGTLTLPELYEGSYIKSAPTGDLNAVLEQSEGAITQTRNLMANLSDITGKIKRGEGTTGRLFTDDALYTELTGLIASMTVLIDKLQGNQERITVALADISENLDGITAKVDNNTGTIGRLVNDPALYDNLHTSTGRIDSILAKINTGQGTAGAIVNDDELYQEVKNLIVRIENLVTDIENNPRKYFKFSVF